MNSLDWLEDSAIAETVRQVYPWIEVIHILGFSLLFGCVTIFDLRLLGFYPSLAIADGVRYLLRLAQISFVVAAISGFLLFTAQSSVLAINTAFRFKLLLLAIAGFNTAVFHWQFSPLFKHSYKTYRLISFKAIAIVSLLVWTGIVICGRFIAYTT